MDRGGRPLLCFRSADCDNYWESNLLDESSIKLIKEVGNYVWEDSQEFYLLENTLWTPTLPATFLKRKISHIPQKGTFISIYHNFFCYFSYTTIMVYEKCMNFSMVYVESLGT